jgi:hypothetical protein
MAVQVMGSLVENGGNLTADLVNREVLEALDQLRKATIHATDQKRLVACYILRELAGVQYAVRTPARQASSTMSPLTMQGAKACRCSA